MSRTDDSSPQPREKPIKPPVKKRLAPKPDPVADQPSGSRIWNLPNELTMLRCVLVIPFAILLFGYGGNPTAQVAAALIFIGASATDFFDGAIARKRNLVTTFGKIADPIADKALTGVAFIGLSYSHQLAWWVTALIILREVAVTLIRFWVIRHGVIAASRGGKAKTVAQIVAIILFLMPLTGWAQYVADVAMGIALVLTLVTGVDYLIRALHLRQTSERTASRKAEKAAQAETK